MVRQHAARLGRQRRISTGSVSGNAESGRRRRRRPAALALPGWRAAGPAARRRRVGRRLGGASGAASSTALSAALSAASGVASGPSRFRRRAPAAAPRSSRRAHVWRRRRRPAAGRSPRAVLALSARRASRAPRLAPRPAPRRAPTRFRRRTSSFAFAAPPGAAAGWWLPRGRGLLSSAAARICSVTGAEQLADLGLVAAVGERDASPISRSNCATTSTSTPSNARTMPSAAPRVQQPWCAARPPPAAARARFDRGSAARFDRGQVQSSAWPGHPLAPRWRPSPRSRQCRPCCRACETHPERTAGSIASSTGAPSPETQPPATVSMSAVAGNSTQLRVACRPRRARRPAAARPPPRHAAIRSCPRRASATASSRSSAPRRGLRRRGRRREGVGSSFMLHRRRACHAAAWRYPRRLATKRATLFIPLLCFFAWPTTPTGAPALRRRRPPALERGSTGASAPAG